MSRITVLALITLGLAACATEPTDQAPAEKAAFAPLAPDEEAVLLLPDPDGGVGALEVSTPQGVRALDKANQGTSYRPGQAPGKASVWPAAKIEAVFGRTLTTQPPTPKSFLFRFDPKTLRLEDASRARLLPLKLAAMDRPVTRFLISAFSAQPGGQAVNLDRSRRLATLMRQALVAEGFKPGDMVLKAFGERRPILKFLAEEDLPEDAWVTVTVQ